MNKICKLEELDSLYKIFDEFIDPGLKLKKDLVFICIGTSKVLFDSVGPQVGTRLKNKLGYYENFGFNNIHVYGSVKENISLSKLDYYISLINNQHTNAFIVAVDASIPRFLNFLKPNIIYINNRGIKPGVGKYRSNKVIGDISLLGVTDCKIGYLTKTIEDNTQEKDLNFIVERMLLIIDCLIHYMNATGQR